MKQELNYLSLPDHFNKFLCVNYNQKINLKNSLSLRFYVFNLKNVGNAIKAVYLLESIYPKKVFCFKLKIKKGKNFEKKGFDRISVFNFELNLTGYQFIDLIRYFNFNPFGLQYAKNIESVPVVNRKLKNFDFKFKMKFIPHKLNQSFNFLKFYHFD